MRTAIVSIVLALGLTPACSGGDGRVDADNTKKNVRDRDGALPTPTDQGNSKGDLELTQKIRQAVVADGTLSSNAHNVKIITTDGAVTLRGPVKDADEQARVVAKAREVAGQAPVDDQLEVETK